VPLRWREVCRSTLLLTVLALVACLPALIGKTAPLPESWLDADALYRTGPHPEPRVDDLSPIAIDLPREFYFARQLHEGWLAQWNPLSACGAPLWAEWAARALR